MTPHLFFFIAMCLMMFTGYFFGITMFIASFVNQNGVLMLCGIGLIVVALMATAAAIQLWAMPWAV